MGFVDLREWLQTVEFHGELKHISGAHWDLEMSNIIELLQMEGKDPVPAIMYDDIPGLQKGFRALWLTMASCWRIATALGFPEETERVGIVKSWRQKNKDLKYIPPKLVDSGPVEENIDTGDKIDVLKFPSPRCHELDGGRYIGTDCVVIQKDPDEGWVNIGTYRIMVVDNNRVALHIVEGQHGSTIMKKYFERGQVMPVAIAIGVHPAIFLASSRPITGWGVSEYDLAGGIIGQPVPVIKGRFTGLPIPAHAEIVIEGEVHPGELVDEGPFGEFHGYYANLRLMPVPEPVVRVKAIHYRNDPILLCSSPGIPANNLFEGLVHSFAHSALVWDHLEGIGLPGIKGVWCHELGSSWYFNVISIKQMYTGHSRQVGEIGSQCLTHSGRYTIVVDDDIDPSNLQQVMWAVVTRGQPHNAIHIIPRCHATSTDPAIPLEEKRKFKVAPKPLYSSRVVIDACQGYEHKADWYPISGSKPEVREQILKKWRPVLEGILR
jgi:UbiD family decarboxylase